MSRSLVVIGSTCVLFALAVFGIISLAYIGWAYPHRQDVDHVWVEENHQSGQRIVVALERYKARRGSYPEDITQLVPNHIEAIPKAVRTHEGEGSRKWTYVTSSQNGQYELWTTTNHWVSSYDILIYHSNQDYSKWMSDYSVIEIGEWRYIIGGSSGLN